MGAGGDNRVRELVESVLRVTEGQRAEWVRRACAGDEELRQQVEAALAAKAGTTVAAVPPTRKEERTTALPKQIGPYRILEVLGEGGFGIVYLAERREPMVQRVALKVIKPGMDSRAVLGRFEAERQALALMDHPNIARVFDAGATAEGRPYFVMEHVPGIPITEHCDKERLTIRQRLELFAVVCDGVAHAHMKGIIHRDIKPSNILVSVRETGEGVPKIIDFGVAKATQMRLTEETVFTEQGVLIGTPEYMSPEQAEMNAQDIDTRSDVYSLGVVLYELLTGTVPFESRSLRAKGFEEIRRVIREVEPERPSTRLTRAGNTGQAMAEARQVRLDELAEELRSELEWIPLKALRKDRAGRYRSAEDLGDEVRRYLMGVALEAGPESTAYRLRKLIRRHRGPVAAVTAVVVVLFVGVIGTTWGFVAAANRATSERTAKIAALAAEKDANEKRLLADAKTGEAERSQRAAEFESYVANLLAADAALSAREPKQARARLDACPERLRGWEWRWMHGRLDESVVTLQGHKEWLTSACFSPDGTRVLTTSLDKTARIWDSVTGLEQLVLGGHEDVVTCGAFSPDGKLVVTGSGDRTARVWDVTTGKELVTLKGSLGGVGLVAFSADGTQILTALGNSEGSGGGNTAARLWNTTDGSQAAFLGEEMELQTVQPETGKVLRTERREVWNGSELPTLHASFSPEGKRVITAGTQGPARVWDFAAGGAPFELKGDHGRATSTAFAPDGTRIATTSWSSEAHVWDAATGSEIAVLRGHDKRVLTVSFSGDGARVLTSSEDWTVRVWEPTTGALVGVLKASDDKIWSPTFSPDGTRVLALTDGSVARIWDATTGRELRLLRGHESWIRSAQFSRDGLRVVTASTDRTARIWNVATEAGELVLKGPDLGSVTMSADRRLIATADDGHSFGARAGGTARLWDAVTGRPLAVMRGHEERVLHVAFSPDASRVASASADGTVRVWDTSTGEAVLTLTIPGLNHFVSCAAFDSSGSRIVTGDADKRVCIWDAVAGKQLGQLLGHGGQVFSAAFSPDSSRLATASADKTVRVWDVGSCNELAVLPHEQPVYGICFSGDGRRLISTCNDVVRLWDALSFAPLATCAGHEGAVLSVSLSPDGSRVATASQDGTVRLWDSTTGKELLVLRGHVVPVVFVAFVPDGDGVITAGSNGVVRTWDTRARSAHKEELERARSAAAKMGAIVRTAAGAGQTSEQISRRLLADASLTPEERLAGQHEVSAIRVEESARAEELNDLASKVVLSAHVRVRSAGKEPDASDELAKAVVDARRAVELFPERVRFLDTLGVALYRVGDFRAAMETLVKSSTLNAKLGGRDETIRLAFLAMAQWKSDRREDAVASLRKLKQLRMSPNPFRRPEEFEWEHEAEQLVRP